MNVLLSALVIALGSGLAPAAVEPDPAPALVEAAAPICGGPALFEVAGAVEQGIGAMAACTASADCLAGGTVNCQGNNNCSAQDQTCLSCEGWVECDGNRTYCPACEQCTFNQCRQGCSCPGGVSNCVNFCTCECECIWM